MADHDSALTTLEQAWISVQDAIVTQAPRLLGALLILLLGWVVAALARGLIARFAGAMRGALHRLFGPQRQDRGYLPESVIQITSAILYWLIILVAVALAAEALGFSLVSAWLSTLVNYVPTLIAGVLIIAVGLLLARLSRDLVLSGAWFGQVTQRVLIARVVYITVAVVTLILGMDQLGVRVSLLVVILAVGVATFAGGLLMAFALGAQDFVRNLIASHQLRQLYSTGKRVRFGEYEGAIVAITAVTVVIELHDGRLAVPAQRMLNEPVVLLDD